MSEPQVVLFCQEHEWRKQQIEKNCKAIEAIKQDLDELNVSLGKVVSPKMLITMLSIFVTIFLGMFSLSMSTNWNSMKDLKETSLEQREATKNLYRNQADMLVTMEGVKRDVANIMESMKEVKEEVRDLTHQRHITDGQVDPRHRR